MTIMDLVEFLLARIAEDEADARRVKAAYDDGDFSVSARIINAGALVNPARVLAECDAKRRIVELHGDQVTPEGRPYFSPEIRLLATPCADHPDYRDEWRP